MKLLKLLMGTGCSHRFSWPRTEQDGRYYQICADCGIAYEYDWKMMKRTDHILTDKTSTPLLHGPQAW